MGFSGFHAVLFVSVLLFFSLPHGSCRKAMETFDPKDVATVSLEEVSREMMQLDYADAGPNVNAKSGYPFNPPPSPSPPPPPKEG